MSDDGTRSRPAPRTAAVQVYAHTGTGEPPRLPNSPPTRPKGAAGGACAISRTLSRTRSRDASPRSKAQPVPTEGERYGAARDALRTAVLETMELLEARRDQLGPGEEKDRLCRALDALAAGHTSADNELLRAIRASG